LTKYDWFKFININKIKGYPVKKFGGRKYFILANVSWIGGIDI
jgi:hypothetical protein